MKLDIQESQDRIDVLEGTTIPTINEQIAAIDSSILDLQEMDKTLDGYIKSLESTAADLQKQIGENKTEVELEIAIINKTLAELKLADLTLEKKVTDLQTYVDTELSSAKDWAEATFSTLTQYEQTQTEISAIKASIEQVNADLAALDARLDGKIEARTTELLSAIAASETNLKTWVGEQLAQSYYDIATLDGILSALSARLDEADTDLQKQVDEQKEALQTAKSELTAAYTSAIKDAISENNGVINASIATAVQKLEDKIQARLTVIDVNISNIQKELANMSKDIASIFEQIAGISSSISDLKDVDKDLDAYIKSLEGELAKMREEFESLKPVDEPTRQILLKEIEDLKALIQALQAKDVELQNQISTLQTYVDTELQKIADWTEATFATLEQYSSVQLEIAAIKTLINKTKSDITDEYTTAIETAISNCETDMKTWVNTQLAQGYYNITAIDGKLSALEALIADGNNNLQKQINEQKTALQQAKTDLTNEYKQYINQAIASGGIIDQAIASQVKKAQDALQAQIDVINERLDSLEDRLGKLEEDFVNRIQSLKYIPEYSDGKAKMSDLYKSISLDFLVSPSNQAKTVQNAWETNQDVVTAFLRCTKNPETKAISPAVQLLVTSVVGNADGTLNVTLKEDSTNPIGADFFTGDSDAVVYIQISDGNSNVFSDMAEVESYIDYATERNLTPIVNGVYQTANCYIVSDAGTYKFVPTQGCSNNSIGTIAFAGVLWETFGTVEIPNVGDLIKDVTYSDGKIIFKTPEVFKEGNAVIAAKDSSGTILWSWHIWFTDQPQSQECYNNAGTMMDRNLGATSATPGDIGALGLLYQWGRKDPFLNSSSTHSSTPAAKSTIIWPNIVKAKKSVDYIITNPTSFIAVSGDWCDSSKNLWTTSEKEKSIYDPCPIGWRVPDGGENCIFRAMKTMGFDSANGGVSCNLLCSKAWLPAAGGRKFDVTQVNPDFRLASVGSDVLLWTASAESAESINATCFGATSTSFSLSVYSQYKSNGFAVRCQKE